MSLEGILAVVFLAYMIVYGVTVSRGLKRDEADIKKSMRDEDKKPVKKPVKKPLIRRILE